MDKYNTIHRNSEWTECNYSYTWNITVEISVQQFRLEA